MSRPPVRLSAQIKQIRLDMFGKDGIPQLSQALGIPSGSWENYESGVSIPATILLKFIELTSVHPHWLLAGEGDRYLRPPAARQTIR